MVLEKWIVISKRILDAYLIPLTKINSKGAKNILKHILNIFQPITYKK